MSTFDPTKLVRDFGDPEGEARACRTACALFDFSFVARTRITGPGALVAIGKLTTRRLDDMAPGSVRYALHTDADGGLVSDLTVWRFTDDCYEVMTGRREDLADLEGAARQGAECEELSHGTAIFAIQGPLALRALAGLADVGRLRTLPYFAHTVAEVGGVDCLIGRLGYTGEAGFELVVDLRYREQMWRRLSMVARPAGFAAADSLRIEAGFPLFANEFRLPVTPHAVGLERFAGVSTGAPAVRLVCFQAETSQLPILWQPPSNIELPAQLGDITVTSACYSIVAGGTLGLGYVLAGSAGIGARLRDPHGVFHNVRIVPRPFYDLDKRIPRSAWE